MSAPTRETPLAGLSFDNAQKADRLEGQSFTNIPKADLTLAMVISRNSKNAVEYMAQVRDQWADLSGQSDPGLDAGPLVDGLTNVLKRSFSRIVRVDSPAEATSAGANLIAVVDLYLLIGQRSFHATEVELKVIFITLDGHPIQTISGVGREKLPYPMWHHHFREASDKALASFEQSFAHYVSK